MKLKIEVTRKETAVVDMGDLPSTVALALAKELATDGYHGYTLGDFDSEWEDGDIQVTKL